MLHSTLPLTSSKNIQKLFQQFNVPHFPEFRRLRYDDKELLESMLAVYEPLISELNFTNLYCWDFVKKISLSAFDTALILCSSPDNGNDCFYPPVGNLNYQSFLQTLKKYSDSLPRQIRFIDQLNKKHFKMYPLQEDRDYWDYIYKQKDLATLQGRRYSKKRNLINQFSRKYSDYSLHPITSEKTDQMLEFLDEWCELRRCCGKRFDCDEFKVVRKCLREWDQLSCEGGYITVEGRIEAFIVAERLNTSTAVIHFEKANPHIPGVYQLVNKEYTARYLSDFQWINREQDIGIPGLRQAKESYYPSHFIKKYTIDLS